jgi:hypothetical protein
MAAGAQLSAGIRGTGVIANPPRRGITVEILQPCLESQAAAPRTVGRLPAFKPS